MKTFMAAVLFGILLFSGAQSQAGGYVDKPVNPVEIEQVIRSIERDLIDISAALSVLDITRTFLDAGRASEISRRNWKVKDELGYRKNIFEIEQDRKKLLSMRSRSLIALGKAQRALERTKALKTLEEKRI